MNSTGSVARKQVGLNAHLLSGRQGYRRAGIHHYIQRLLSNTSPTYDDLQLIAFTNNANELTNWPEEHIVKSSWPTDHPLMRIAWEQLAWPVINRGRKFDLIHSLAFVSPILETRPTVVTVYDLSFLYFPEQYPSFRSNYLRRMTQRSCQRAERVIAISESGRQDIHREFGIPLTHIDVIPPGVDPGFRPLAPDQIEAFRHLNNLPKRFLLHVGTLQPRKNILVLLQALVEIGQPDLALILVGGKGWYYDQIFTKVHDLGLDNQVHFVGYVPDDDLCYWYNSAEALIFPSLYEGFGMPALEAMACGTPVIASNTSSLPEVVSGAGRLFDPQDSQMLAGLIKTVLGDVEIAVKMRQNGLRQATNYTWIDSGQKLISVYRKALQPS